MNKSRKLIKTAAGVILIAAVIAMILAAYNHLKVNRFTDYGVQSDGPDHSAESGCSIFIYLCGSSLESRQGLAGQNLSELLRADIPDNVNVVIETGGAEEWHSHGISSKKLQRYIIKDNKLKLIGELPEASMGSADTFADFLKWGNDEYPAGRNIVVMWDHGGGSAEGVCFDEKYDYDCLDRSEIREALSSSGIKGYDMLIFDACFMGSIETADTVKDHFRYMVASQKVIPGVGMDYAAIIGAINRSDNRALGKIICDSFYEKCKEKNVESDVQMSLFDLKGTDKVIKAVNSAGKSLLLRQKSRIGTYRIIEAASSSIVANAGEKINIVDLQDFMGRAVLLDIKAHKDEVRLTMEALVPYQITGENAECNGISLYYPVNYDEYQLEDYLETCPIENYRALLENVYYSVSDDPIEFDDKGSINDDGDFEVRLTEESRPYLFAVNRKLWKESLNSPGNFQLLGTEAVKIFDTGLRDYIADLTFSDSFDGRWYYLGGYPLLTDVTARHVTTSFSAPVKVNDQDLTFTFVQSNMDRRRITPHGLLSAGFDRYGHSARSIASLKAGDNVQVYNAIDENGELTRLQDSFTVDEEKSARVRLLHLPEGRYRMQYAACDILGNSVTSNYAMLEIKGKDDDRIVTVTEIREAY